MQEWRVIIYRNTNRGAASSFAQGKHMAQLGITLGDSYLMGNLINDSDCLLTYLLIDKDTVFNRENSGLTAASLKTFNSPTVCKMLNFQRQTQKQPCLKGRLILLTEMKGLRRHGVTLFFLVRMPQNTVNVQGTALTGALPAPWRKDLYLQNTFHQ